nr:zinc finger protein 2-like [Dermacentor andersoni]
MAEKETAGPHFTMSGGSCNVDQGASCATSHLDNSGVPEETRETAWQQRENQQNPRESNRIQECRVCRFAFTDMEALEQHAADHVLGKHNCCFECGKLFRYDCRLRRHLSTHGEPPFKCSLCGKRYHDKGSLKIHMLVWHVDEAVEEYP